VAKLIPKKLKTAVLTNHMATIPKRDTIVLVALNAMLYYAQINMLVI